MVKILTGDLRIGLREGLVEEAIARAFDVPLDEVSEANMLLGDIGATAALASRRELDRAELSIFRPIKCMLATPEPTAEAIWARFAHVQSVYVEDKFDGIRAQLHRDVEACRNFFARSAADHGPISRNSPTGREISRSILSSMARSLPSSEGRKLTFFDLQKRLGRKTEGADLFSVASADVPVEFVAFDLLWLNGRSLQNDRLRERRELLRKPVLAVAIPNRGSFPGKFRGRDRANLSSRRAAV